MKKHLRLLIAMPLFLSMATAASAQFGIHTGYSNSVVNVTAAGSNFLEKQVNHGLYIGFDYDIEIAGGFSVQPAVYYSYSARADRSIADKALSVRYEQDYIEHSILVPLHAKYNFEILPDVLNVYLFAGPTIGIGLSAVEEADYDAGPFDGTLTYNYYTGEVYSDNLGAVVVDNWRGRGRMMQRFDVLVGGGAGLRIMRFLDIKTGYDYGLVDRVSKNHRDSMSMHLGRFYVGLGVRF